MKDFVIQCIYDWRRTVIYDAFVKLNVEYGGMSATDEGGVKYVLSDWQGSVRASLSNSGYVKSRTDYQAFGEEIQSGIGMRSSAQVFGGETGTRQGYGLTEKDEASGLNHTWFRKNENRAGRWTSPDPYNGSASLGNPQSFNRYSYVENEPTNFVDPSGLLIAVYRCERTCITYWDDDGTRHDDCQSGQNCRWEFINIGNGPNSPHPSAGGDPGNEFNLQSPTTGPNRYFQHCIKNLTDRVKAFVERNTKPIDLFNLTPEDFAGNLPGVTVSAIVGGILGGIAGGLGGAALGALGGAALGYVASLISVWSLRILGQFVINQAVRTAAIARLALGIGSCITYPGDTPLSRP